MRTDAAGNQVQTVEGGLFSNLFDSHRKIERWGIFFGVLLCVLAGSAGYSFIHYHNTIVRQEMMVSPSGTQVKFSKAGATLTVQKAQMSHNGKWVYIPFSLSNMKYLPNDPSNYRILIQAKGRSHAKLYYKPVTRLILFGSSGKGAIAIYSSTGIQNQPINIYLLNMKNLAKGANNDSDTVFNDANYGSRTDSGLQALMKKYDMVTFNANPGATDVAKGKRTTANIDDKDTLYMSLFGGASRKAVDQAIASDWEKINNQIDNINEDRSKLTQMGYNVPDNPAWMKKDWQPFDAVDVNTGKTKTGKNALTYLGDSDDSINSTDDKDNVDYPTELSGKNGQKISTDDSDDSANADAKNASDLWQDLQTRWDDVHSLKRDIYVNQQIKLCQLNQERKQRREQTTIGPTAPNLAISKVDIKTSK